MWKVSYFFTNSTECLISIIPKCEFIVNDKSYVRKKSYGSLDCRKNFCFICIESAAIARKKTFTIH